jgi:hypothetical protein
VGKPKGKTPGAGIVEAGATRSDQVSTAYGVLYLSYDESAPATLPIRCTELLRAS